MLLIAGGIDPGVLVARWPLPLQKGVVRRLLGSSDAALPLLRTAKRRSDRALKNFWACLEICIKVHMYAYASCGIPDVG
jgi:hypothetical protein